MQPRLPEPISRLVLALGKLPGIGPRSAERLALFIVQSPPDEVHHLADALRTARDQVGQCTICGALTDRTACDVCEDSERDPSQICVVERAVDIFSVEKAAAFRGRYHVLGGKLSPINGIEPEDLRIAELVTRSADPAVSEVIIALSMDVEGDATGFYLAKRLQRPHLRVTRLAQGMPSGTGLEFTDQLTLGKALEGRRDL